MNTLLRFVLTGGLTAICALLLSAQDVPTRRPFEVRDSIEMKVFSDPYTRTPGATAKEAPDGSGYVVVTTQGRVESNTLESSLWYFVRQPLVDFLNRKQVEAPHPRLLFRKMGVPRAEQQNSYGSLITDVQWSSDSRGLAFLVEADGGKHHLFEMSISHGRAIDITPNEKGDISDPAVLGATTLYLVSHPTRTPLHDSGTLSTVITGKKLVNVLFPESFPETTTGGACWKLHVRSGRHSLSFPEKDNEFFPSVAVSLFHPSVSPDGSYVITVVPVSDVPQSWAAYRSANTTLSFRPSSNTSDHTGNDLMWPWQYAIIDLRTARTVPLVIAPTGFTTAWGNPYRAKWSHSGENVIVTNTFLPLEPGREYNKNSVMPCAIAEYSVKTHATRCVATTPALEQGEHLVSADYDDSDNITARWLIGAKPTTHTYFRDAQGEESTESKLVTHPSLELYLRQDLDVPPTLWVRNGSTERLIWDPNPQLRHLQLGKATPYQWTDSSGYTWHGGLVLPPEPKPESGYPLVIQTHGFYNNHEFLVDGAYTTGFAAQPLACAGIAVLQMEDRPDKRSRPAEEEADDAVRGIERAIDQLSKDGTIDVRRVGLLGFSRTHWYVEKALERSPKRYTAAILIDGVDQSYVTDVIFGPGSVVSRQEHNGANGAPPFGAGLSKWVKNAGGFNLDKITAPLRLVAIGAASVLGEWETYSMLQQQGKPVDLIEIPNGQHILQKPAERYACQQGTVDWFRFWLQGYGRISIEMQADYERWETLRATHSTNDAIP